MRFAVPLPAATGNEAADLDAFAAWELAAERHHHPDRFDHDGLRKPPPRRFDYYLGVPEPSWLGKRDSDPDGAYLCTGIPKFVSAARLARLRSDAHRWPVTSVCTYAIDSGAYIALTGTNRTVPWFAPSDVYGGMVLRFMDNNGYWPDFCVPQDWPCEPTVRAKTGLTVRQHQQLTLDSYLWLAREFSMAPWIPVLQGWEAGDYLRHARMYEDAGIDLAGAIRVGVGSICRRGHLPAIVEVIEQFAEAGYPLHGFGIKTTALPLIGAHLRSADSMAWSTNARKNQARLPDCTHVGDCRNCYRYAVHWRQQVLASLPNPEETAMPTATAKRPATTSKPATTSELFAGLADFAALVASDLGLTDAAGPRIMALVEVEWGMYGTVKGYCHDGTAATVTGYVTKLPRLYTGGTASPTRRRQKFTGEPLLSMALLEPLNDQGGACEWGFYAAPDAVFTVLEPPADRPLRKRKYLGRRMPVADLRRGDVFYIWDEPGLHHVTVPGQSRWDRDQRPRYHLQSDPIDVGAGQYALDVLVNGTDLDTRELHGTVWADVEDPRWHPWKQAHAISTRVLPGQPAWWVWDCSCGVESNPENRWSHASLAQQQGAHHAAEAMAPETVREDPAAQQIRAGAYGNTGDEHSRTITVGDHILGVCLTPLISRQVIPDFAGVVAAVSQAARVGEQLPWVTIELQDGTERAYRADTLFSVAAAAAGHELVLDLAPGHWRWTYIVGCGPCGWKFGTPVDAATAPTMFERHHLAKEGVKLDDDQRRDLLAQARRLGEAAEGVTVAEADPATDASPAGTAGDGLDDVRGVLARSTFQGTRLVLPSETIPHTLWQSVHAVLTGMGAKGGRRRGQPYKFDTDRSADVAAFTAGGPAPLHERTTHGWVRTPDELAADVVARFAEVGLLPDRPRVLEPSAGDGSLIRAVWAAVPGADIVAVEPVNERAAAVSRMTPQVTTVHETTLEKYAVRWRREKEQPYDLIVMNPPYSVPGNRSLWADHVKLAWSMLAEGGRLVAILPGQLDRRTDKAAPDVLALLGADARVEQLPAKSFHQYGVDIDTCVIAASKAVTSVDRARVRYAASIYDPPVYDVVKTVRLVKPRLTARDAIEHPMQVVAGFAGDVRIVYAGKCIACSVSTWTDGNNDPRGYIGTKVVQPLRPTEWDLAGPEVCVCWDCSISGIMHSRALQRAREMWTDPDCEPDEEPEELTVLDLDELAAAVDLAMSLA